VAPWGAYPSAMENSLILALRQAVQASPDELPLRLHLGALLLNSGDAAEAIRAVADVLVREPLNADAGALMASALLQGVTGIPDGDVPEMFDWSEAERQLGLRGDDER
jgi:cytochrome c-type biogenesis protein CcmH/NrfG